MKFYVKALFLPRSTSFYVLPRNILVYFILGPDMPSYADHFERNWLHWCVGNIPGGNVSLGLTVTPYCGLTLGYELGKAQNVNYTAKMFLKV